MTPRPITAICVTYARTALLENALSDLQDQDARDYEILVFNTCPKQKLEIECDTTIINCDVRPPSLGEARNMAIKEALNERIVICDDDDAYLPHFIKTFQENWDDDLDWIWLTKRLWAEGKELRGIVGACHGGCFGFTKKAWAAVGGYPALTVGEDRVLVSKITQQFKGKKVEIEGIPPFICRTGQGSYHISGLGEDNDERMPAHHRIEADFIRRLGNRSERTGTIVLKPHADIDWSAKAAEFMAAEELKKKNMSDVCIVQLGRYGDIINMLPIALHIHNSYGKPALMVTEEFAPLLDGVSYVTPYPVKLATDQLNEAIQIAEKNFKHVIVTQIWGKNYHQDHLCASYNRESWRKAGFENKFRDYTWKPVFDKRDDAREQALLNKATGGEPLARYIVVAAQSISSPFPHAAELLERLKREYGNQYQIVDITPLRSDRIYDVLKLLEMAEVVVTVDTAIIHLMAALPTPAVCLVNPNPWLGSEPRCNYLGRLPYDKYPEHFEEEMNTAIVSLQGVSGNSVRMLPEQAPSRRLFHVVERHAEKKPSEANRKGIAQRSWEALKDKGVTGLALVDYARNASQIGDPRALPYLKDVLQLGLDAANPEDIIFWTNDDNVLHPDLPEILRYHCSIWGAVCSQRCEFKGAPMPPLTRPHTEFAATGRSHMGRDLFAFTKAWLMEHWDEIPDFILGASDFDLCLAMIVRNSFGIKSTRQNIEDCILPAELERGYVSHQWHAPAWNHPGNTNTAASQLHNRALFKAWAAVHAPHLTFDQYSCI